LHSTLEDLEVEVKNFVMSGARPSWKRLYRFVNARGTQERLQDLQSKMLNAITYLGVMANLAVCTYADVKWNVCNMYWKLHNSVCSCFSSPCITSGCSSSTLCCCARVINIGAAN
jgi:hypothetical protein